MVIVRSMVFLLGLGIIVSTLSSAVRQCVLPGRKRVRLSRILFRNTFRLFGFISSRVPAEAVRDTIMANYAPFSVMLLPATWATLLIIGHAAVLWSLEGSSLITALAISGAALTTQDFIEPRGMIQTFLYISAGIVGLGIISLLISFLPTLYAIYSQREEAVTRVALRFGVPPSGVKILQQVHHLGLSDEIDQFWHTWEEWFTDMDETHISNIEVIFYRSAQPTTSWITTAGAILDACALFSSTLDRQNSPWLTLCFRAGCCTLTDIATELHAFPGPLSLSNCPIHVTRGKYDTAYEQLRSYGIPLKSDREACWQAFITMRRNYDIPLIALANITFAPTAPWSSDRRIPIASLQSKS